MLVSSTVKPEMIIQDASYDLDQNTGFRGLYDPVKDMTNFEKRVLNASEVKQSFQSLNSRFFANKHSIFQERHRNSSKGDQNNAKCLVNQDAMNQYHLHN